VAPLLTIRPISHAAQAYCHTVRVNRVVALQRLIRMRILVVRVLLAWAQACLVVVLKLIIHRIITAPMAVLYRLKQIISTIVARQHSIQAILLAVLERSHLGRAKLVVVLKPTIHSLIHAVIVNLYISRHVKDKERSCCCFF
jgi:hypothetical protein